ncbi:conserved protein of unknown function [Desulfovibrio sp. 86]|nr:conserved protein of unknown function [Desulfovibrio sp. 86]
MPKIKGAYASMGTLTVHRSISASFFIQVGAVARQHNGPMAILGLDAPLARATVKSRHSQVTAYPAMEQPRADVLPLLHGERLCIRLQGSFSVKWPLAKAEDSKPCPAGNRSDFTGRGKYNG